MTMIPDISDEGLVKQFGDVMFEIPELFEALRRFELESRPAVPSGGLRMNAHWALVQRGRNEFRIRIGNPGRVE